MYKFLGENTLFESIIYMLSIFRKYGVNPIFVFDGKPPPEKKRIIQERQTRKKEAEEKYNVALLLGDCDEMKTLQKQVVRINDTHIQQVKELVIAFGAKYCVAEGEADEVCAKLVLCGEAWGCLSEDMDMFLYGCPRILRQYNMYSGFAVIHDLPQIINDLELESVEQFRDIVVSTGLSDFTEKESINNSGYTTLLDALTKRQLLHSDMIHTCDLSNIILPPILGKDETAAKTPQTVLNKLGIIMI
jgi:5'-3' exonuclease